MPKNVQKFYIKIQKIWENLWKVNGFPSVPDGKGDLKVEEQAFIKWCRCERVDYDKELLKRFLKED